MLPFAIVLLHGLVACNDLVVPSFGRKPLWSIWYYWKKRLNLNSVLRTPNVTSKTANIKIVSPTYPFPGCIYTLYNASAVANVVRRVCSRPYTCKCFFLLAETWNALIVDIGQVELVQRINLQPFITFTCRDDHRLVELTFAVADTLYAI
jgi:hypothetical protein